MGNVVGMDPAAVYSVLRRESEFDVGIVFATDGRIAVFDLVVLSDDQAFFPSYLMALVVRQSTLERHPELRVILETLSAQLDNPTMATLNAAVDLQGRKLEASPPSSSNAEGSSQSHSFA